MIVTILGDLCRSRQDTIPSKSLHRLTGRMGVSDQAVRVALHRLRRNGWVESQQTGRESSYSLSEIGWGETQRVRGQIYPEPAAEHPDACLIVAPSADLLPDDALIVAPRTAVVDHPPNPMPKEVLVTKLDPGHLPDWLVELLAGKSLREDYATLAEIVARVVHPPDTASMLDATVLRLLILHQWRRLRLRHSTLPDSLLGPDWEGARARASVMQALKKFKRPRVEELSEVGTTAASG